MKTALLFPGQGAQTVGMGRTVLDTVPAARALFDEAKSVLGYDLADVCLNGPKDRLDSTAVSQPAIFTASLAALEVLKATDPDAIAACVATAGLSLGEYTALVFAGAMSFRDGLTVVKQRGEAMQAASDATPSGMLAVLGADRNDVAELCAASRSAGPIEIANLLCPSNIVVSGTRAACAEFQKQAEARGSAKVMPLAVAGAFHTAIMKPADERLAKALEAVPLTAPRVPVWSNVDARPHTDPTEIRALLVRQVLEPVMWEDTLRGLLDAGVEAFHEVGPGRVLAGLMKRVHRKADFRNTTF